MNEQGWIEHDGGECPVSPDTIVDYLIPGETADAYIPAPVPASDLRWKHMWGGSEGGDIIAYRIVEPGK